MPACMFDRPYRKQKNDDDYKNYRNSYNTNNSMMIIMHLASYKQVKSTGRNKHPHLSTDKAI